MILLDLMMHGINGWQFRTAQLADPHIVAVPVVVCSGDSRLDEKAEALGIVDQLPKPIDQRALLKLTAFHCGSGTAPSVDPEQFPSEHPDHGPPSTPNKKNRPGGR